MRHCTAAAAAAAGRRGSAQRRHASRRAVGLARSLVQAPPPTRRRRRQRAARQRSRHRRGRPPPLPGGRKQADRRAPLHLGVTGWKFAQTSFLVPAVCAGHRSRKAPLRSRAALWSKRQPCISSTISALQSKARACSHPANPSRPLTNNANSPTRTREGGARVQARRQRGDYGGQVGVGGRRRAPGQRHRQAARRRPHRALHQVERPTAALLLQQRQGRLFQIKPNECCENEGAHTAPCTKFSALSKPPCTCRVKR